MSNDLSKLFGNMLPVRELGEVKVDTAVEMHQRELATGRARHNTELFLETYNKLIDAGIEQHYAVTMADRLI